MDNDVDRRYRKLAVAAGVIGPDEAVPADLRRLMEVTIISCLDIIQVHDHVDGDGPDVAIAAMYQVMSTLDAVAWDIRHLAD